MQHLGRAASLQSQLPGLLAVLHDARRGRRIQRRQRSSPRLTRMGMFTHVISFNLSSSLQILLGCHSILIKKCVWPAGAKHPVHGPHDIKEASFLHCTSEASNVVAYNWMVADWTRAA